MGLLKRILQRTNGAVPAASIASPVIASSATSSEPPRPRSGVGSKEKVIGAGWPDIEVAGESYHRAEIGRLFRSWGLVEGGVTMRSAVLVPEPTNKHDRNAVKVTIDGLHVGYVPAENAPIVGHACRRVPRGMSASVPVRIWGRLDGRVWRARITLAFSGELERERDFAREAAREREAAHRAEASRRVGAVRGEWWGTYRSAIAELKRQGHLEEALELIGHCAEAAARVGTALNEAPDPWPVEQQSIVLRKLKDPARELAAIERYVAACGEHRVPEKVQERLARARVSAG